MTQIIDVNAGRRFRIENAVIDGHGRVIGALGVAVYAVLARHAQHTTGEGEVSIAQIARALYVTLSEATDGLARLAAAGLITVAETGFDAGGSRKRRYRLLDPSPEAVEARFAARKKPFAYTPSA
jgi:DNA-binding MarR family transcriptional regulator